MKNILFIAPPAGGKGTYSDYLAENYGYAHISTGDLLRDVDPSSELGIMVNDLISKGELVPDEIVLALLKTRLDKLGENEPFILDGFPRNIKQAEELDTLLNDNGKRLDLAIELDVPYDVSLKRAIGRYGCPKCKAIYNIYTDMKPLVDGICDKCGEALVHRSDDNEETFKVRYDKYMTNTKPLIEYYRACGKLKKVNGINNTVEELVSVIKNDNYQKRR